MTWYRRYFVPGGTYFFTIKTAGNLRVFSDLRACRLLGHVVRSAKTRWTFEVQAAVLLPDHLHTIWTLPAGDDRYPARWGWIKKEFSKAWLNSGGPEALVTASQRRHRRRGVWQRRYWEYTISDAEDFERHFDYIHFNPVKHGCTASPADWPHSSFRRWVGRGVYPKSWAQGQSLDFSDIAGSTGE